MIQARNICLAYGEQTIFDDISFTIGQTQRIGLVGRNGAGKSTLLKAIAGQQPLDSGSVAISGKKTVAYMAQEVVLESDKSVLDETMTTFAHVHAIEQQLHDLEKQLEADPDTVDLELYADLHAKLAEFNQASLAAQAQRVLTGLGFKENQLQSPVSSLSVGWKMRIVLAKLLLQKADFYLFDEPTNHLDIVAKDWFLDFLRESNFGFMLVSHERHFLDSLCNEILEVEFGNGTFYYGNYAKYIVEKEQNLAQLQANYQQQQRELKVRLETVERFRAKASKAKMAQSMLKQIDKIERIEVPPQPKIVDFKFPPIVQPGRIVLDVKKLSFSFGEKKIFEQVNVQVERGEKIAVVAANGVGKTTLFNVLVGQLPHQSGSLESGYNVTKTIFAQDQTKSLDMNKTVIENVLEQCPKKTQAVIRSFLGAFLFSGDDVNKKVGVLSGGEKNRVGMVCVLLQDANFLLLDEPTNHLDIPSKETLLNALKAYAGTILFVSHDHDFVNRLATRIIELTPTGAYSYIGNYDSYLYQKKALAAEQDKSTKVQETNQKPAAKKEAAAVPTKTHEQLKQLNRVEERIAKTEKDIAKMQLNFAALTYGTLEFRQTEKKLTLLQEEHKKLLEEWEKLSN